MGGLFTIPVLQIKKLRLRKGKSLAASRRRTKALSYLHPLGRQGSPTPKAPPTLLTLAGLALAGVTIVTWSTPGEKALDERRAEAQNCGEPAVSPGLCWGPCIGLRLELDLGVGRNQPNSPILQIGKQVGEEEQGLGHRAHR